MITTETAKPVLTAVVPFVSRTAISRSTPVAASIKTPESEAARKTAHRAQWKAQGDARRAAVRGIIDALLADKWMFATVPTANPGEVPPRPTTRPVRPVKGTRTILTPADFVTGTPAESHLQITITGEVSITRAGNGYAVAVTDVRGNVEKVGAFRSKGAVDGFAAALVAGIVALYKNNAKDADRYVVSGATAYGKAKGLYCRARLLALGGF